MIAWSCGGGLQSVAIGVLIREGALPKPDLSGIADTGRERRTTWEYLDSVLQPYLDPVGVKIERIPHEMASADLYTADGKLLIPAYDGHEGRLSAYCSGWWKRDVFERWLRSRGVVECDCWIGFSIDELSRVKNSHRQWCNYEYPLIDKFLNRAMCRRLIEAAGLPVPKKSRCWGCPHQDDDEWAEVQADPVDWPKALELDQQIRDNDERDGLYLYSGRVPLAMADFGATGGLVAPSRPCETGHCWT